MFKPGLIDYIGNSVVVLGHHNADPDAIGAAQGVKELVLKLKPGTLVNILMPEDISSLSRNIIKELELSIVEQTSQKYDTIVVVDSGGLNQLGEWREIISSHNYSNILIDHHTLDKKVPKYFDLLIIDDDASSTSELVYFLYEKYGISPTEITSKALLAGIVFDSSHFSHGSSQTFYVTSCLLETVGDISKVRSLFNTEVDLSERIARLKTAKRLDLHRIGDWIVVFSEVGSYQASGARALITLGADLAVVIGSDNKRLRVSIRSAKLFFEKTQLHLGEFLSEISSKYGGHGSGHPTAAGYNGVGSIERFKKILLKEINQKISLLSLG